MTIEKSSNDANVRPDVQEAIRCAQEYLLAQQHPQGYWVGELEADASVSAGYVPIMYFMLGKVDPIRQAKAVSYVRSKQNPDGSWSTFPGGPGDLNVSIQVYFALKLAGVPAVETFMLQGREFILAQGGVRSANVFTKIWLALFGQYDWRDVPRVPPEVVFLPNWFYFNIYDFASWSRATIMALSIVLTTRPVCIVPESANVLELYAGADNMHNVRLGNKQRLLSWRSFFLLADRFFKVWERLPFQPGRKAALRRVEAWIVEHQEADGSWGGIMLPWMYSLFALKSLGYQLDHPVIARGLAGIEDFIVEDDTTLRLQPAVSPVWDTAWSIVALRESGLAADHPALQKAARWLLKQENRHAGDWKVKNPQLQPGSWSFEFNNNWYPDLDDTALVPRALRLVQLGPEQAGDVTRAVERALGWILGMQSKDGGWASFDRDNDKQFLAYVPFADFMSPLDPTCADVTAHVVELLSDVTCNSNQAVQDAMRRAINYLKATQESDHAWYGRWGVNYIYGTGLALAALAASGEDLNQDYIQGAADWLAAHQNPSGGWGESCQ
ncbi:MAG: squalene--hopene cyclase, partial [Anaerolineales bacterium]|nr:squalene--hopene cyclase [Anaerolineales bacterium]